MYITERSTKKDNFTVKEPSTNHTVRTVATSKMAKNTVREDINITVGSLIKENTLTIEEKEWVDC